MKISITPANAVQVTYNLYPEPVVAKEIPLSELKLVCRDLVKGIRARSWVKVTVSVERVSYREAMKMNRKTQRKRGKK